jgi:predicted  nucleic acid-binding Zn ribbon protein
MLDFEKLLEVNNMGKTYYESTQVAKHSWKDQADYAACASCQTDGSKRKPVTDKLRDPINMHNLKRRDN